MPDRSLDVAAVGGMTVDLSFQASNAMEAEERLASYGEIRLTGGDLRYVERTRGDARIAFVEMEYGGNLTSDGRAATLTIASADHGYQWEIGRERGSAQAEPALFQQDQQFRCHVDDTHLQVATFDSKQLQLAARTLYADDRLVLRFDSARPQSAGLGELWVTSLQRTLDIVDAQNELLQASLRGVMTALALDCFRLAGDTEERRSSAAARLRTYHRAVRFIDDHLSLPITLSDIAEAAAVPVAELQAAFEAHAPWAANPLRYLRTARLSAAHLDLVQADPTLGDTVQAIARRWGFSSPSVFARQHREVYGQAPKWFLDR